jgi:putative hydrolase of the HAD superfamily
LNEQIMSGALEMVALDADDTLWHNETVFRDTETEFRRLLARYHDEAWIEQRLYETEVRNLAHFGYGVKSFILSMVETAVELTEGRISGAEVQQIIALGRAMLSAPVALLEGVAETLGQLAGQYELMLITKGDLLDQESKLERSGLRDLFRRVEVVSRKDVTTYSRVLAQHRLRADHFVMVGNSLRSDVIPVLDIGGWAVHIPYHMEWEHERTDAQPSALQRYRRIDSIQFLPESLRTMDPNLRLDAPSTGS